MNNRRLAIRPAGNRPVKGFTLVELLMVVSIIALLVSILVPALQNAQIIADTVRCSANLRQIMLAAIMYTGDNDDRFFPRYDFRDRNGDGYADGPTWYYDGPTWGGYYTSFFARQYLGPNMLVNLARGEGSVYDCPLTDEMIWYYHMNYGYNMDVGPNFNYLPPVKRSSLTNHLVIFADAISYGISSNPAYWTYWDGVDGVRYHPDDRFNAAFVDGHVDTLREGDLDDSNWIIP